MNHIIGLIVGLLGGSAAVIGLAVKYGISVASQRLPGLIGVALADLEKNQEIKSLIIANRPAIEGLFDQIDAAAKGQIDGLK